MMTTNLFVIDNVKQLRTLLVLEFYCLFFWTSWSVGVLNSAIFNSFHIWVEFGTILEALWNFRGGLNPPNKPPPPPPPPPPHNVSSIFIYFFILLFFFYFFFFLVFVWMLGGAPPNVGGGGGVVWTPEPPPTPRYVTVPEMINITEQSIK
jgi:hypothetical protein